MEFCLVRRAVGAITVDGPDDDRDPERQVVHGNVTFTPMMKKGETIQYAGADGPVSIIPKPIEVRISDGIIMHRGGEGVKLYAGGPGSNPETIRWKATFSNMQASGWAFTLAPIVFDAVPGGEIDLTLMAPIGDPAKPIVRGPAGTSLDNITVDGAELVVTVRDEAGVRELTRLPLQDVVRAEAETAADLAAEAATGLVREEFKSDLSRAEDAARTAGSHASSVQDVVNDAATAILNDVEGSLDPVYVRQDDRTVHVKNFGAVGDGVTDDTAALQAALNSGQPLYWGGAGDRYRTTAQLNVNAAAATVWRADGATVICDALTPVQRVFSVELQGHPIAITGPFVVNANRKAFSGIYIANAHDTSVDAALSMVTSENAYRSSRSFTGGDGIALRGAFRTITLDRPIIRNIVMATGAGIAGAQGVTGINITSLNHVRAVGDVVINAPFIDGVFSEDTASNIDQDGIKVFGPDDVPGVDTPFEAKFHLAGGTIRNCGGRAVKSQTEWGSITGLKIYRGQARTQGGPDIDFQVAGGQIANITAQYEGNAPSAVVNFSGPATAGKIVPHGSLTGLKVLNNGSQVPESLVTFNQRSALVSHVSVRDVEAVGTQPAQVVSVNGVSGGRHSALVSEVFAGPTYALVRGAFGSPDGWTGDVVITNCVRTGSTPVPAFRSSAGVLAAPTPHFSNVVGFTT